MPYGQEAGLEASFVIPISSSATAISRRMNAAPQAPRTRIRQARLAEGKVYALKIDIHLKIAYQS
jgi:hypothetical protein